MGNRDSFYIESRSYIACRMELIGSVLWYVWLYNFEASDKQRPSVDWNKARYTAIHGTDGWAGAVMGKLLAIQKYYGRMDGPTNGCTDQPTRQGVEPRVRD